MKARGFDLVWPVAWIVLVQAVGCGPDGASRCKMPNQDDTSAVAGRIYLDQDASDLSMIACGFEDGTDLGLSDLSVMILGEDAVLFTKSCKSGAFVFNSLDDGLYLLSTDLPADFVTTTKNVPRRLPEAVEDGEITLVAMGDSLPVVTETLRFPDLLADELRSFATVNVKNIAQPDSQSADWLPGEPFFEELLVPDLPDADVLIISLGGNDIVFYAMEGLTSGGLDEMFAGLGDFMLGVMDNILTITQTAREYNPDLDVVYLFYPNYMDTQQWSDFLGPMLPRVKGLLLDGFEKVMASVSPAENLILVDMYGITEEMDISHLIMDEVHLNDQGHTFYAQKILETLGGVRTGESPLGLNRSIGILPAEGI